MNPSQLSTLLLQGRLPRSHLLQIHAQIILSGAHQDNLLATRLIGHYHPSPLSLLILSHLQSPNIFPFNAALRVLSDPSQTLSLFLSLKRQPLSPNDFTFSFLLKGLSRSSDPLFVRQAHTHVVKSGFGSDPFVCNGLLSVYSKGVRDLGSAHKVFDEMPERERAQMAGCWTGLIAGFAQSGENERALEFFMKMLDHEQVRPDGETMVSVLSACATLDCGSVERWIDLFEGVASVGRDQVYVVLTYLYGKVGDIGKSRASFDGIGEAGRRSVVTWNAMINAYVQNGCASEALSVFREMLREFSHVQPNHVTLVGVVSACAQIGDIDLGVWIHEYVKAKGKTGALSMNNSLLATAMIDMNCKCGNVRGAEEVFSCIAPKDVISVNAMIMGLAANGKGDEALRLFDRMPELHLRPNAGTFLGALYACSHSGGKLDRGRQIFQAMRASKSTQPQLEHYSCYIDLLARVGCIEEALEVVTTMPIEPNSYVWGALLSGCLLHSRTELAREISKKLVEVDPGNSGGYVMLSNSLASGLEWDGVYRLRGFMKEKGVKKHPGCSWISVDGVLHQFLAGVPSHPDLEKICYILDGLEREMRI